VTRLRDRLLRVAREPRRALRRLRLAARARTEDAERAATFARYGALARRAGFDRLYLFLSFDCDTDEDFAAAPELDRALRARGIEPCYAVPGAQLRKGEQVWRRLAERGAAFLNHGGRAHAAFEGDQYQPITFYERLSKQEVAADIEQGHRDVCEIVGRAPTGFRAPHFGSFQAPEQLAQIYAIARRLGYRFCSTTLPSLALAEGPVVAREGLYEIPLFGSWRAPTTILDSWTYLADRRRYALSDVYHELFAETVERLLAAGIAGLLSYYADPSHVAGQAPFERVLALLERHRIPSLGPDAIVARAAAQLGGGA
jgi:peptidoglycan/xylan/chitin deacetylase (PgdA/CDA1 family)